MLTNELYSHYKLKQIMPSCSHNHCNILIINKQAMIAWFSCSHSCPHALTPYFLHRIIITLITNNMPIKTFTFLLFQRMLVFSFFLCFPAQNPMRKVS